MSTGVGMFIYCWLFTAAFFERATFTHTSVLWSLGRFPKRYLYGMNGPVDRQDMAYKGQGTITLEEGSAKALLGCTSCGGQNCKVSACGKKPKDIKGLGEAMLAFFKLTS